MRLWTILCGLSACVLAQFPGAFAPTGSMATPRFNHSATLLNDGRVLIAGGYINGSFIALGGSAMTATAEIYDPSNGTFSASGNMLTARAFHTATLLPDGRVLIGGGQAGNVAIGAELYDPSTRAFTATGSMSAVGAQDANKASLLSDGRVLFSGGRFGAVLYDSATGTFVAASTMNAPQCFGTSTLLADGRVLLAYNFNSQIFDPAAGTFSLTGDTVGYESQATLLLNGKVLASGGNNDPGPATIAETYDPANGLFALTGSMTEARANHGATLLPDGTVLLSGGSSWTGFGNQGMAYVCCLGSAELYDPSTGIFSNTGWMAVGRAGHTSTLLNNGKVLVAGGGGTSAEIYTPWSALPPPVLLSLSGDGQGPGAIQHGSTYQIVSADNPAVVGEIIVIYCTGLVDGSVVPPRITIGGRLAQISFFGDTPGFSGLNQINAVVPAGITPGNAVAVRMNYLGRTSNVVTIGVNQ